MALSDPSLSGSAIYSLRTPGTTCQETPNLSLKIKVLKT